jgi:hypothetical protein
MDAGNTKKRKWNVIKKKATRNVDAELEVLKSKLDALVVWTYEWPAFTTWESALVEAFDQNRKTKLTGEKCVYSDIVLFFCLVLDEDEEDSLKEIDPDDDSVVWFSCVPNDVRGVIFDPEVQEFDVQSVNIFRLSVAVYDGVIDDESYGIWSVFEYSVDETLYQAMDEKDVELLNECVDDVVQYFNGEHKARYNIQAVVMSYLDATGHYVPMERTEYPYGNPYTNPLV